MKFHRIEVTVEEIDSNLKDDVRRKFVRLARKLGLDVYASCVSTIEVE